MLLRRDAPQGSPLPSTTGNCPALQAGLALPQSDLCRLQVLLQWQISFVWHFLNQCFSTSLPGLVAAATVTLVARAGGCVSALLGSGCCILGGFSKHGAKTCSISPSECGKTTSGRTEISCAELVIRRQNNSCCCRSGYGEVNGWHVCVQVFHNALPRAGRGHFCHRSPHLGCDSCRGGVEGPRAVCGGGCFCLWKRGRKRRPVPPHGVRCSLTRVCSISKKPLAGAGSHGCPSSSRSHGRPSSSQLCLGGHEPTRSLMQRDPDVSLHPPGCLPKRLCCCSGATKRWDSQKSRLCFENLDPLQMPTALDVVECAR